MPSLGKFEAAESWPQPTKATTGQHLPGKASTFRVILETPGPSPRRAPRTCLRQLLLRRFRSRSPTPSSSFQSQRPLFPSFEKDVSDLSDYRGGSEQPSASPPAVISSRIRIGLTFHYVSIKESEMVTALIESLPAGANPYPDLREVLKKMINPESHPSFKTQLKVLSALLGL